MDSIDIPAHGRVWFDDDHMASRLALAAIEDQTRYVQARVGVGAAVFANGKRFKLRAPPPEPNSWRQGMEPVSSSVCQKWLWNDALNTVHSFQPPIDKLSQEFHVGSTGVNYTCSVSNDVLHCPE